MKQLLAFLLASSACVCMAGLDAVDLDLVPSNILVDCKRSFFRSSDADNRTLYVTPHVVAGRSPIDGDQNLVHAEPDAENPGAYLLSIGVFFPRDAEDATNSYEIRDAQGNFCNFESVMYFLNAKFINPEDHFTDFAHLPLTSVEISIANLEIEAETIGTIHPTRRDSDETEVREVDVLEYNDNSYEAQFRIDEDDLDYINNRFARDEGLQLNVKYNYQSRQKDGSVRVNIDGSRVAANFQAAAGGQKYLVKAQLHTHIQSAVRNTQIEIDVETGSSDNFGDIAEKLIAQVLENVKFTSEPEALEAQRLELAGTKVTEVIEVKAVADYLSSSVQTGFTYKQDTPPGKTTNEVPVWVKSEPLDPRLLEITLRDGFDPVSFPNLVNAGETIKITPAYSYIGIRQWKEVVSYLTSNQLSTLGIYDIFLPMRHPKMGVQNIEENGRYFAEGHWRDAYYFSFLNHSTSRWRRTQRFPVRANRHQIRNYQIVDVTDLELVPVTVAFSQVGGRFFQFTLADLLEETDLWDAKLEYGTVVLTAKTDLGLLTFREKMSRPYYNQLDKDGNRIYPQKNTDCTQLDPTKEGYCEYRYDFKVGTRNLDEVVQENYCGLGYGCQFSESTPFPIKGRVDRWALDMYQAVQLSITRPIEAATEKLRSDSKLHAISLESEP